MSILINSKKFILDTLFPISCLSCGHENVWLCESCFQKIQPLDFQVCPQCEKLITEKGAPCDYCKKSQPALNNLVVATKYKNDNLSKLVHLYKYNFVEDLHVPLGHLLVKIILKNNLPLPNLIVPVPLHKRRLRWRGFNQSKLLANYISESLTPGFKIPVAADLIIRQKYTPPQMQIGKYSERRKNMQEAFQINKKYVIASEDENDSSNRSAAIPAQQSTELNNIGELKDEIAAVVRGGLPRNDNILQGKKILLIDDIATTGATLFECAKICKLNGAKKVMGAVIARQEFAPH